MSNERKVIFGLVVVILAFCVLAGHFAGVSRHAIQEAQVFAAQKDSEISVLNTERLSRDEKDAEQREQAKADAAKIKTGADAVRVITKIVTVPGTSPLPSAVVVSKDELPAAVRAKMPDAPSYVAETEEMAKATAVKLDLCAADQRSLLTCKADLVGSDAKFADEVEIAKHWQAVAKGGSKWQRVRHAGLCLAVAGAGAYAGAKLDKQDPAQGAAVGGAGGVVACTLF